MPPLVASFAGMVGGLLMMTTLWLSTSSADARMLRAQRHLDGLVKVAEQDANIKWTTPLARPVTLAPIMSPDGDIVFVASGDTLYALAASDGAEVWSTPLASPGFWLVGATLAPNGKTLFVTASDGSLFSIAAEDGKINWTVLADRPLEAPPTLLPDGTLVFIGSRGGTLYALDTTTGDALWSVQNNNISMSSPILVSDDGSRIFATDATGVTYAIRVKDNGTDWRSPSQKFPYYPAPSALSDDGQRLFVPMQFGVNAYRTSDGSSIFSVTPDAASGGIRAPLRTSPDGKLWMLGLGGVLVAMNQGAGWLEFSLAMELLFNCRSLATDFAGGSNRLYFSHMTDLYYARAWDATSAIRLTGFAKPENRVGFKLGAPLITHEEGGNQTYVYVGSGFREPKEGGALTKVWAP